MFKTDNSLHVFVSNVTSDLSETISAASNNQIVIVKADGTAASTGSAVIAEDELVKVAMKDADGNVRTSPLFKFKKANVKGLSYAAKAEQVTTLASIPDTANNRYVIRVNVTNDVDVYSEQSEQYLFEYTTGGTVASAEVVDKFVAKINGQGGLKDRVTAAKASATSITLTGKAQKWSLGLHTNTTVSFDVTLENFGATTNTLTTAPDPGSGEGKDVAELEWFGLGASGAPYRQGIPSNTHLVTLNADSAGTYDVAVIDTPLVDPGHAVAGSGSGKCQIVLAMATGAAGVELDEALGFTDDSLDVFS